MCTIILGVAIIIANATPSEQVFYFPGRALDYSYILVFCVVDKVQEVFALSPASDKSAGIVPDKYYVIGLPVTSFF